MSQGGSYANPMTGGKKRRYNIAQIHSTSFWRRTLAGSSCDVINGVIFTIFHVPANEIHVELLERDSRTNCVSPWVTNLRPDGAATAFVQFKVQRQFGYESQWAVRCLIEQPKQGVNCRAK
jgi:hypothetical protein